MFLMDAHLIDSPLKVTHTHTHTHGRELAGISGYDIAIVEWRYDMYCEDFFFCERDFIFCVCLLAIRGVAIISEVRGTNCSEVY